MYYNSSYLKACSLHGDGEAMAFCHEKDDFKVCLVALKSDISNFLPFKNLEKNKFYDLSNPYGYTGFLIKNFDKKNFLLFLEELQKYCEKENIISLFLRFDPINNNQKEVEKILETKRINKTIFIDTENENTILANMHSKCRNTVRKCVKEGVKIFYDKGENLDHFLSIYNETMKKNNASSQYYYKRSYFEQLIHTLKDNIFFFHAKYKEKIIASSIILRDSRTLHYHLSGTKQEYKNLNANSLILFEVSKFANKNGIKKFHLGGGLTFNDSLFRFKKRFNKNGVLDFYVGKIVFLKEQYDFLVNLRNDSAKNKIIEYRS